MVFEFNVYKESKGYFIVSTEYNGLFGYSPTYKDILKNAKDIAGLFEFDFPKGKNNIPDLPFVKKIKIKLDVKETV
ncbi:MAG: hypothetical protein L3J56_04250 [Bacteroidales bacterium]|nr:hypothetical protein [Bacteroidales bacterium]MCF6365272.1 hypothetical protein [Bacteroidales bacterium]